MVDVHALVPDLDGLVDGDVEEIAVVRDQHEGVLVVVEIIFQPVAGFQIQMVGGLVEQQKDGFCSSSLASAMRICQPPENSSVRRAQSSF